MITQEFFKLFISQFDSNITWIKIHNAIAQSDNIYGEYYHKCNWPTVKGDIFEFIAKFIFIFKGYKQVYLYKDIPSSLKSKLNLPSRDEGIDLIVKSDNRWIGIQCKWRGSRKKTLNKSICTQLIYDINDSKLDYGIICTNVDNITPKFSNINNLKWYTRNDLIKDINNDFLVFMNDYLKDKKIVQKFKKEKEVREYQQKAIKALISCNEPNKQCIMACGTGKTHIMFEYIKKVNNKVDKIVMLFPSLQLINQVYKRLRKNIPEIRNILCICSQMDKESFTCGEATDSEADDILNEFLAKDIKKIYTTDIKQIKDRLSTSKILILCTYQSSKLLKNKEFDLGLFDEAHKTVNNPNFGYLLDNKNCKIKERIYFTATPRYYKGVQDKCISMNNKDIYGDEVYNYTFKEAIEDNYILDFNIIGYVTHPGLEDIIYEKYIEKDGLEVKANDVISAIQLAQHIKKSDKDNRILTYHNTVTNAINFKKTLNYVFNKYDIEANIFVMSGKTRLTIREQIINEFASSKISVICSSRVLNEGVDIPCVNTVMFVEPRRSTIDVTQCVGRAMRLHNDENYCDIIIPIHYDNINEEHNYSNIIEILTAMSEINDKIVEYFINRKKSSKIKICKMDNCIIDYENNDDYEVKYNINDVIEGLKTKALKRNQLLFEYKKQLLFEFCDLNKRTPKAKEIHKGQKIGTWFNNCKIKLIDNLDNIYIKLSQNVYIKQVLDNLLNYRKNNIKKRYSWEEKKIIIEDYFNKYNKLPQKTETYNDHSIGTWLYEFKKSKYKFLFKDNEYIYNHLNTYLTNLEKFELYCDELEQYTIIHNKTPPITLTLGRWYSTAKKNFFNKLQERFSANNIIIANLEKFKNTSKLSMKEKQKLFLLFVQEKNRIPQRKDTYNGYNIGSLYHNYKVKIKQCKIKISTDIKNNPIIYKNILKCLDESYTLKENIFKLINFCKNHNRLPKQNDKFDDINMYYFYHDLKKKIYTEITKGDFSTYSMITEPEVLANKISAFLSKKNIVIKNTKI